MAGRYLSVSHGRDRTTRRGARALVRRPAGAAVRPCRLQRPSRGRRRGAPAEGAGDAVQARVAWQGARADLADARDDPELNSLAADLESDVERLEEELKLALVERDPADAKDVIVEIRQGVGGDEAAIWAGDVYRMLTRYAERRGFRTELLSANESESGGFKEVVFAVKGDGAFSVYKYEGGTHRVQRVPETESQGRIHTSTATVAVMPEVEDVEIEIAENDLKIDVYRSTVQAARASTPPTRPCASRTCRPASSSRCRTRSRSSRTGRRRCACFAPASTSWSARSSRPSSPRRGSPRSVAASGRRRSAPTTTPRTGSPTTGSSSPRTGSTRCSTAICRSSRTAIQAEDRRLSLEAAGV